MFSINDLNTTRIRRVLVISGLLLINLSGAMLITGKSKGFLVVAAFYSIVALVLYFEHPHLFFYFVVGYLFFGDFILSQISLKLPMQSYFDEMFTFGLLGLFLLKKWSSRQETRVPWIGKYILVLVIIILSSAIANRVPPIIAVNYLATFLKPIALFYVIVESNFSEKQLKNLIWFLIAVAFIESIFTLAQIRAGMVSGLSQGSMYDAATGTLSVGLQHHIGYLMLILTFLISGIYFVTKKRLYLLLIFIFTTVFYLTRAFHAVVLVPFVVLFLFISLSTKKSIKAKVALLIAISIMAISILSIGGGKKLGQISSMENIMRTGKFISYRNLITKLPEELSFPGVLVGAGPGMYASEIAIKYRSPLFLKHVYGITAGWAHDPRASIVNHPWTSAIALLGELGPGGFIIYFLLLFKIYKLIRDVYLSSAFSSFWRGAGLGVMAGLIFMCFMAFIMNAFEDMFMTYPLFVLSGILVSVNYKYLELNDKMNDRISRTGKNVF